jgi:hypothetical protein
MMRQVVFLLRETGIHVKRLQARTQEGLAAQG